MFIFTFSLHLVFYFVRPQKVATCWLLFTSHQAEQSATASSASLAELPCVCERLYNRMRWLVKLDAADTPTEINIGDFYSISTRAHSNKQIMQGCKSRDSVRGNTRRHRFTCTSTKHQDGCSGVITNWQAAAGGLKMAAKGWFYFLL